MIMETIVSRQIKKIEDQNKIVNNTNVTKKINIQKDLASSTSSDMSPLLMGMFVLILFSARISGSHFNPIITFSYMVGNVKQGKFDRILGILYMVMQFAGAFCGSLFCSVTLGGFQNNETYKERASLSIETSYYIQTALSEITGAFLMVFMYLCSTEDATKFTKDSVVQTMILASSYLSAMMLAGTNVNYIRLSPVNPAIALSMQLTYSIGDGESWPGLPIFVAGGFAGSLAAFLFFRFVYKNTADAIHMIEAEEAEADDLAHQDGQFDKVVLNEDEQ